MNCAGIAPAKRIVGKEGAMPLAAFKQVIDVNLIGTFNVIAAQVDAASMDELHKIGDEIKKDFQSYVAILAIAPEPEKVQILVLASKNAVENGVHAGELAKVFAQELGGNGGGKADMAQAGAKNPEKVQEGLQKTLEVLRKQLGAEQSKSK